MDMGLFTKTGVVYAERARERDGRWKDFSPALCSSGMVSHNASVSGSYASCRNESPCKIPCTKLAVTKEHCAWKDMWRASVLFHILTAKQRPVTLQVMYS